MRFRTYSRMKDSGVDWLGVLPEHWTTQRLKYLVDMVAEKTEGPSEELPYVGLENIEPGTGKHLDSVGEQMPGGTANLFSPGDVLFGKLRPYLAKALRPDFRGRCTSELLVLRPRTVNRDYLFYLCLSDPFIKVVDSSTYGTRMPRANWEFIGNLPVPLPPYDEQVAIRDFLETYTQSIDNAVEKYRLLIDHLQEYRQTLITQAVTKGLDPNVPMKESGIPWIGAIPQHWTVTRIRHGALLIQVGSTPPTDVEEYYQDGSIPWYGPSSFGDDIEISEPVKMIHESALRDGKARKLPPGTTLVVTIGATIGKTGYLAREGCTNQQITGIVPRPSVYPRFLAYYCRSLEPLIRSIAPNTTLPILNQEKVGSLPLLLPPREEQQVIAEYLDRKLTSITSLADQLTSQIQFLQEYRQALITAAVTGKIDVRQEVQEHAG